MLVFLIPKPPVPAVPKALTTESKNGILQIRSATTSAIVRKIYIKYRISEER